MAIKIKSKATGYELGFWETTIIKYGMIRHHEKISNGGQWVWRTWYDTPGLLFHVRDKWI